MNTNQPLPASVSRRELVAGAVVTLTAQACESVASRPMPEPAHASAPAPAHPRTLDMERFVADCVAANEQGARAAVREVLARGVSNPAAMLAAVGEPRRAGLTVFHRSPTLTIFAAVWTPQMNLMPHDHRMWALIGIYTGREDNILWRHGGRGLEACGVECLFAGDVAALPETVVHSVTNPLERYTGGIHVYGGDFFATKRSQWDPETLAAQPSDGDVIRQIFERANERQERLRGA